MRILKTIIILLFPHFVSMFVRLTKKPVTVGMLDVRIEMDPLWNHVLRSDHSTIALVKKEYESGDLLLSFHEAINLVWATKATSHISGSIAEVGSFHGGVQTSFLVPIQMGPEKCTCSTHSRVFPKSQKVLTGP